jgi:hypothetical protein
MESVWRVADMVSDDGCFDGRRIGFFSSAEARDDINSPGSARNIANTIVCAIHFINTLLFICLFTP